MTLERAVSLLTTNDEETLIDAANRIQSLCFLGEDAKKTVCLPQFIYFFVSFKAVKQNSNLFLCKHYINLISFHFIYLLHLNNSLYYVQFVVYQNIQLI